VGLGAHPLSRSCMAVCLTPSGNTNSLCSVDALSACTFLFDLAAPFYTQMCPVSLINYLVLLNIKHVSLLHSVNWLCLISSQSLFCHPLLQATPPLINLLKDAFAFYAVSHRFSSEFAGSVFPIFFFLCRITLCPFSKI
jgi:hypothetical protein